MGTLEQQRQLSGFRSALTIFGGAYPAFVDEDDSVRCKADRTGW